MSFTTYSAFKGENCLVQGDLAKVIRVVKGVFDEGAPQGSILIFSDETGNQVDFNFQGSEEEVLQRLNVFVSSASPKKQEGPGRPRLGVVAREVSLLPKHWEWLAIQSGGASASLRRLVEQEMKTSQNSLKQVQERTYRFMSVMAGDRENYEEALRSLYKNDSQRFKELVAKWPKDIRKQALQLYLG